LFSPDILQWTDENCRTGALGGHRDVCGDCGHERSVFNSCRNRHCPKCQALTKAAWLCLAELDMAGADAKALATAIDVEAVKAALKRQVIETPSWGYANSGTRFKAFPWPGAATTTRQKLDDAAMVHKMTGIAGSVAVHIPWDVPEDNDYVAMCQYAEEQGIRIGAVNPNVFQDEIYRLGSLGNPDSGAQEQALDHLLECCEIMT